jgi:hypothetical protein
VDEEQQQQVVAEVRRILVNQRRVMEPLTKLDPRLSAEEIQATTDEFKRRVDAQGDDILRLACLAGNPMVVRLINEQRNIEAGLERQASDT